MTFTNLTFFFIFLPIALFLNWLISPKKHPRLNNLMLLLLSLLFYTWGDAKYLVVLILSIVFNYASSFEIAMLREAEREAAEKGRRAQRGRTKRSFIVLVVTVIIDAATLAIFKYSKLAMPIGISFYTFSALSFVFDVYYGKTEMDPDPLVDALYIAFFPKLISGPIVQYKDFKDQLERRAVRRNDMLIGGHLFLIGLFKKVLLADNLSVAFQSVSSLNKMASLTAWLGMIFYSLELYFDFSGYSDMAIGISRMLGFKIDKNFNYPYLSDSVSDFWRRWHISLGHWFRDYVYIPMGGNRCSTAAQLRNLLVVWVLTGIWHGNTWNFLVWGLYHGAFVIAEKFLLKGVRKSIPHTVLIIITDLIVFIGWVFFFSPSLGAAFSYLGQMFGAGRLGFANSTSLFYLTEYLLLLVAAGLCSTKVISRLHNRLLYKNDKRLFGVSVALHVVLLVFCIANMVGSTYSTFLYFQF